MRDILTKILVTHASQTSQNSWYISMILSTFISNKPKSRSDRQYIYMWTCSKEKPVPMPKSILKFNLSYTVYSLFFNAIHEPKKYEIRTSGQDMRFDRQMDKQSVYMYMLLWSQQCNITK